jgi:hypothetical protein
MSKFENKAKPIRELINNPDVNVLANKLNDNTEGLHTVVPNIAQALQTTGARALNYLNTKMPKPINELIGDQEFEPTKSQQRQWLSSHDIVDDPISALDHVRHGTLTSDHMDALTQVHPELLNEMRQKVMEQMEPNKVKNLPMSTKLALGTFLGSPVTESSLPQAVMANQIAMQPQPPPQQSPKSTVGGLEKLDVAKRAATETTVLDEED